MRRCVWSRNLKNEEAMACVRPHRHGGWGVAENADYSDRLPIQMSEYYIKLGHALSLHILPNVSFITLPVIRLYIGRVPDSIVK